MSTEVEASRSRKTQLEIVTQVLCVEGSPFCALRSRVRATQALCFQGSRSALAGQSDRASHWLARRVPLSVVECLRSDRASHWLARRVPLSVVESLRVWRGCALGSPLCALCSVLCALRSRVRATLPASGEACAVARSRVSTSVARLCSGLTALRSALWALLSWLSGPARLHRSAMAARFTAAQVLEQILSSVDQEDYSDCQEEEEEEVSEDEDGEEYNPERREVDDASSPSSEEEQQPEEEPPEDRDEEEISSAPDRLVPVAYGRHRGPLAICRAGPDQTPGPTAYAATQARDIASAFHLFVTPAIERIIVEMTNLHGARKYGDGWRPMDATDLRAYLGLLILAGVYRSRGEAAASLWDAESGRTVFRATMSLKVFHRYSRLLRFDDRQSRPARLATDKLAAIREVWDLWEARLPALYNPGPDVTVDEQLVPFRGRCPFRQYIPSKPAKYGIKSWVACDAKSSYAWKMQVYTGKAAGGGPEKNQGMRVVLDLTTGLSGRNVTCDNFFTSYDLGQRLLERNLTMVGTVRRNKAELPPALLESRGRQVLSSRFAFTPTATLVSYLAKRNKNVLLLSTLHTEGHISDRRDKKPALILDYNCNKGGVDNLDKVVGTYSCRRMTARWPLVVFHNILDVSSYNAFVIWREIKPDWMPGKRNKRRVFLEQLGKALVKPLIQRRQHLPRTEAASALVKVLQSATAAPPDQQSQGPAAGTAAAPPVAPATTGASKRKRCQLCPPKKDSKTHTVCCRCKKYICKGCSHAYCHTCAHWAFSQDGTG
ncbi:piggyBac transposable element-derived protein 4-like [Oncorhynchus tshawytscha]|uniref:piggyBac transposable element-derived protein 4-like n=1 Tax=Oncorhynchus tshawytscha TaxID=74940 RepID=UPI001C3E506B|nr:piggyBac transposable element-derived protein 4-like [Oncorhynchus tshawytscha]